MFNNLIAPLHQVSCDKDLSKKVSGQTSLYTLAFFVPDTYLTYQVKYVISTAYFYLLAFKTLMSNTVYDGLTLQNKKTLWRIYRAVTNVTESKTRHL